MQGRGSGESHGAGKGQGPRFVKLSQSTIDIIASEPRPPTTSDPATAQASTAPPPAPVATASASALAARPAPTITSSMALLDEVEAMLDQAQADIPRPLVAFTRADARLATRPLLSAEPLG